MDAQHFDRLTRALSEAGSRRGLLGMLTGLPLVGGLAALLDAEAEGKGRPRHQHRSGDDGLTAERKRRKKKHKKKKRKKCRPQSVTTTCAGKCGSVLNNCKQTVDCGSCACAPPCEACFTCEDGPNTPGACVIDPDQQGEACGDPGQLCQSDGACACDASSCSNPTPVCVDGSCAVCSAEHACPDGCCAADGTCQPGTSAGACGADGTTCQICRGNVICDGACLACDVCEDGCTYSTVQAAVADPSGPSTIRICAGFYTENITIGRALTLLGAGQGNGAGDTILQGAGSNVVLISGGPVTLQALRITGGTGSTGAGVRHGGDVLTMLDCTVTGNSNSDNQGGGVGVLGGRNLVMTGCTVSDNHANGTGNGGGLDIRSNAVATLTACTVSGNTAGNDGGGIFNDGGQTTLDGGTVTGNDAGDSGGGIFNTNGGTATLSNGASVTGNDPNNCAGDPVVGCSG
jgi:hypothetical protein